MESLPHGRRRFYDIENSPKEKSSGKYEKREELLSYINKNVIGSEKHFLGPFGARKVVYCDYTASGKSLNFIENFIHQHVLPEYGNTHTTTTVTSLQTTLFKHEARDIVRNAVNASEYDAVIFTGSGCTGAVHKLISALKLHTLKSPPVIFCGPYEHHSNLLPWRELGSEVINIQETGDGQVDLEHLVHELKLWRSTGRQLIGCFAAASNVTGVLVDVDKITVTLHRHGALALWDYATAGPYVNIDMNPVITGEDQPYVHKDAVFISTHKYVGGVQTPGILVAKKKLFANPVPSVSGGGTVFFVRREAHRYLQEVEMREEGGTPAIVESIRAGLVFQLKQAVGADLIMEREHLLSQKATEFFSSCPNLILLGPTGVSHLPIFSFMIKHPETGHLLHHNYVCALLNDMFGVQARGGCACAGPYAQELLGIDEDLAKEIEDMLIEDDRLDRVHLRRYNEYSDKEILRPGFVRLNLPYFMDEETIQFVLEAVRMVALHGWKMLPQYNFNPETGEWRHRTHQVFKDRKWLGYVSYKEGEMTYSVPNIQDKGAPPESLQTCLSMADQLFKDCKKTKVHLGDQSVMFTGRADTLRWFLLPSEAYLWLQSGAQARMKHWKVPPFAPTVYPKENVDTSNWTKCTCQKEQVSLNTCRVHCNYEKCSLQNNEEKAFVSTDHTVDHNKVNCDSIPAFKDGFMEILDSNFTGDACQTSSNNEAECIVSRTNSEGPSVLSKSASGTLHDTADYNLVSSGISNASSSINASAAGEKLDRKVSEIGSINKSPDNTGSNTIANGDVFNNLELPRNTSIESKPDGVNNEAKTVKQETKSSGITCLTGVCAPRKQNFERQTENVDKVMTSKYKWHPPPKQIFKPTIEALEEYKMIQNGDKVLVCLSGGKDSLSLLHTLRQYQFYGSKKGVQFELGAVTVDPQTEAYDPSPLKGYLAQLGVPYLYEEQCIMESALNLPNGCASICSYCSRMKRGRIYSAARRESYNVLALGQHLDDLAESFLMSVFQNGNLRTMKASYTVQEGDLRVIRPFVYVREKDLRAFAIEKQLPVIAENCPACFEVPKERHRMKQLLASQEILHPRLFHSMQAALRPIMAINKTGINVAKILGSVGEGKQEEDGDIDDM